jgi:hypothetical protein
VTAPYGIDIVAFHNEKVFSEEGQRHSPTKEWVVIMAVDTAKLHSGPIDSNVPVLDLNLAETDSVVDLLELFTSGG